MDDSELESLEYWNTAGESAASYVNSKAPSLQELPDDIVVEVLVRLPVKSILRFKCVCKAWLSLFSSKKFINEHLNFWTHQEDLHKLKLLLISYPFDAFRSCSLHTVFHEPCTTAAELDYQFKDGFATWMVGSCNGLVCNLLKNPLTLEHSLVFWNPSTRNFRELPQPKMGRQKRVHHVYGFGYNQSSDDYKVVKISYPPSHYRSVAGQVRVFSRNSNSWKRISDTNYRMAFSEKGKFAGGSLNWSVEISSGGGGSPKWGIVSFDLAGEELRVVAEFDCGFYSPVLHVMGGCLCVLFRKVPEMRLEMWVWKEYGVAASWTALGSICGWEAAALLYQPEPFYLTKDGEMLFCIGGVLSVYDTKEKRLKECEIYGGRHCHQARVYLESLISPFGCSQRRGKKRKGRLCKQ
ncbi:F-box/kelch-repeat protein At3g23880 [Malania oleifera]|uniref:F-box/kelch-repeat protein At3g23880 n=1 Tax=Malania oleifera TaxID=397392 RepID=UPI0025AE74EA|nr:F-box/kelch-repeat protein At3g23880 [Malania oleifera]